MRETELGMEDRQNLKRVAMQLAALLPQGESEALLVLDYLRELVKFMNGSAATPPTLRVVAREKR
jgi:hypothetical protein